MEDVEPLLPPSDRLLRGSAWTLSGRLAGLLVGLGTSVLLARVLVPSQLGVYFLAASAIGVAAMVAQFGMNEATVRLAAESIGRNEPGQARSAIRLAFGVGAAGIALIGGLLVVGGWRLLSTEMFHSPEMASISQLTLVWLGALVVQSLLGGSFRGLQQMRLATVFDGLLASCLVLVSILILWVGGARSSLMAVVSITVVASATAAIIGALILRRHARRLEGRGSLTISAVISVGWPLLFAGAASTLIGSTSDLWVLAAFRPPSEVAVYGGAARLAAILALPFVAIAVSLGPIMAELSVRGKTQDLQRLVQASTFIAAAPALLALLVFVPLGGSILGVIFGSYYSRGAPILLILSLAQCVFILTGPSLYALIMGGHSRLVLAPVLAGGLLAICGDVLAAPRFGAVGVATATSVALVIQNLAMMFLARRRLGYWTYARLSRNDFRYTIRALRNTVASR